MTRTDDRTPPSPVGDACSPATSRMVMATGIIAVAASQQDLDWLAEALYVVAAVAYVVLAVLLVAAGRAVPVECSSADVTNHAKGFAFLTIVAGTNVLGSASVTIHGWYDLAWVLWWVSLVLWAGVPLRHAHRGRDRVGQTRTASASTARGSS